MLREDFTRNETNARLMQIILRGTDQLESFLEGFSFDGETGAWNS